MNTRNSNDDNWYLDTLLNAFYFFAVIVVLGLIGGTIYLRQCTNKLEKPKTEKQTYTKPEIADSTKHDWGNDSLLSVRKIESLNELFVR